MSSLVPKTAWRVSNLNKRYGVQAIGLQMEKDSAVPANFNTATPNQFVTASEGTSPYFAGNVARVREQLLASKMVIDVRDASDKQRRPLGLSRVATLHVHDLLSGAACGVLPHNRGSPLVVVGATSARCRGGFNALRRFGYTNVSVMDDISVLKAFAAEEPKSRRRGRSASPKRSGSRKPSGQQRGASPKKHEPKAPADEAKVEAAVKAE